MNYRNGNFIIADICFSIETIVKEDEVFSKFSVHNSDLNPDVRIKTSFKNLQKINPENLIFKADRFWSIYNNRNKYILLDHFNSGNNFPARIGIFNSNYTEGDVFIDKLDSHQKKPQISNPLSYPIGSVLISNLLAKGKGVFIHAAGITASSGKGYLFCGKSEAGKSTIARLWRDYGGITVLNDDRVIIRKSNNKFYVYGCPWHTTDEFISNKKAPIDKVFFICHGEKNTVKKLDNRLTKLDLLKHTYFPIWDRKGVNFSLQFLEDMVKNIECFNLKFVPDESVIESIEKI